MQSIVHEMDEELVASRLRRRARDIGCGQAGEEHCEIARYGLICKPAQQLGVHPSRATSRRALAGGKGTLMRCSRKSNRGGKREGKSRLMTETPAELMWSMPGRFLQSLDAHENFKSIFLSLSVPMRNDARMKSLLLRAVREHGLASVASGSSPLRREYQRCGGRDSHLVDLARAACTRLRIVLRKIARKRKPSECATAVPTARSSMRLRSHSSVISPSSSMARTNRSGRGFCTPFGSPMMRYSYLDAADAAESAGRIVKTMSARRAAGSYSNRRERKIICRAATEPHSFSIASLDYLVKVFRSDRRPECRLKGIPSAVAALP